MYSMCIICMIAKVVPHAIKQANMCSIMLVMLIHNYYMKCIHS